jgi:hypothetical protein
MNTPNDFSQYYAELLEGTYDCVDRIVLNAFFPMGQTGGGMRSWWRQLQGDDSNWMTSICARWQGHSPAGCMRSAASKGFRLSRHDPASESMNWLRRTCPRIRRLHRRLKDKRLISFSLAPHLDLSRQAGNAGSYLAN